MSNSGSYGFIDNRICRAKYVLLARVQSNMYFGILVLSVCLAAIFISFQDLISTGILSIVDLMRAQGMYTSN